MTPRVFLEFNRNPSALQLAAQQLQKLQPPDRREADAVDDHRRAAVHDRDVGPGLHRRRDPVIGLRVVGAQEFQRPLGEHHAEAEGGVARVLLDDAHLPARQLALHEVGEVQARRPRARNENLHACAPAGERVADVLDCPAPTASSAHARRDRAAARSTSGGRNSICAEVRHVEAESARRGRRVEARPVRRARTRAAPSAWRTRLGDELARERRRVHAARRAHEQRRRRTARAGARARWTPPAGSGRAAAPAAVTLRIAQHRVEHAQQVEVEIPAHS